MPEVKQRLYEQIARLKNSINKKLHGKATLDSAEAATELAEFCCVWAQSF
jgi:hypothetical protein